jgi:hypothetical protein
MATLILDFNARNPIDGVVNVVIRFTGSKFGVFITHGFEVIHEERDALREILLFILRTLATRVPNATYEFLEVGETHINRTDVVNDFHNDIWITLWNTNQYQKLECYIFHESYGTHEYDDDYTIRTDLCHKVTSDFPAPTGAGFGPHDTDIPDYDECLELYGRERRKTFSRLGDVVKFLFEVIASDISSYVGPHD